MENKQIPSKKSFIPTKPEKILREVDYESIARSIRQPRKELFLDLEILQKNSNQRKTSQRVLVSIKPRPPAIKTIYIAEKSRFQTRKSSEKSRSRLAIGDHSSFTTRFSDNENYPVNFRLISISKPNIHQEKTSFISEQPRSTSSLSAKCFLFDSTHKKKYNDENLKSVKKCFIPNQPQITMTIPKNNTENEYPKPDTNKIDIATLVISKTSSEDTSKPSSDEICKLQKRIYKLERKVLKQEMVLRTVNPTAQLCSSDEESNNNMKTSSATETPGCSYIEYSHIPETSAFQRYAHQTAPLSPSKATTIDKEHNSEQYGRNFTTYDGITARGRRQSASVPCKRNDVPRLAAERVHKIRHKLNPVRDYRLMDTVHYLAQGEFAPRDDGIKLTPSREAVLSDIIWEDVCRTHWPSARLGRRGGHTERCSTRSELQRLIDSLLRERVAHVERRRRRHYRIVKLNHRQENCRPVGKTGDIIVASHKNKALNDDNNLISDHKCNNPINSQRKCNGQSTSRCHNSHECSTEKCHRRRYSDDECIAGPSSTVPRSSITRDPTCCFQTSSRNDKRQELISSSSTSACKLRGKNPRFVVKKEASLRKYHCRDEANLEHYILLPTLVVRTPSNMKRQKKFNELYHRILNIKLNNAQNCAVGSEAVTRRSNLYQNPETNDIGQNINIQTSDEQL